MVCATLSAVDSLRSQSSDASPQQPGSVLRFANGGNAAQVPAQFIREAVFIPLHINRKGPCLFLLNSTGAGSSIDPDRAAELGIADLQSPVISLSGVEVSLAALPSVADKDFASRVGRPYEGTLGNDFLASLVAELDYDRRTVRLYDPATYRYGGSGASFPTDAASGIPVIHAKFTVGGKTLEGDFAVNTALDAPVRIFRKYAEARSLLSSHLTTIRATDDPAEDSDALVLRLKYFQIGPFVVQMPLAELFRASAPPKAEARFAGEIGAGMLRRFIVTFDAPHHRIVLDANRRFRDPDREDMSGLSVIATGRNLRRFEVVQVWPGTPGADAGVQKGDVIAGVDEEPAADLTLADLRELFSQLDRSHRLVIERHGKTIDIPIQLRRLL